MVPKLNQMETEWMYGFRDQDVTGILWENIFSRKMELECMELESFGSGEVEAIIN